jgi:hypothetical protein
LALEATASVEDKPSVVALKALVKGYGSISDVISILYVSPTHGDRPASIPRAISAVKSAEQSWDQSGPLNLISDRATLFTISPNVVSILLFRA